MNSVRHVSMKLIELCTIQMKAIFRYSLPLPQVRAAQSLEQPETAYVFSKIMWWLNLLRWNKQYLMICKVDRLGFVPPYVARELCDR